MPPFIGLKGPVNFWQCLATSYKIVSFQFSIAPANTDSFRWRKHYASNRHCSCSLPLLVSSELQVPSQQCQGCSWCQECDEFPTNSIFMSQSTFAHPPIEYLLSTPRILKCWRCKCRFSALESLLPLLDSPASLDVLSLHASYVPQLGIRCFDDSGVLQPRNV